MSVLVEFSIGVERFELGTLIAGNDGMEAEFEPVIPTADDVIPYMWVTGTGEALDALEASLQASEKVASVESLDDLAVDGDGTCERLFHVDWRLPELDIIRGIVQAGGVVLEGHSVDGHWKLRFRFPDHEHVAAFYQHLAEEGVTDFRVESIYELQSRSQRATKFNLTPEQREAITLAAERGYFSTPRQVTLSELGEELGISEQAFSQRLRPATEEVVRSALDVPNR